MATPEAPRPPEMGMARALNKGAPGQQMGRMTGLSPVPRRARSVHRVDPGPFTMPPTTDFFFIDGTGLTVPAGSIVDLATIGTRDDESAYMSWDAGGFIVVSAGGVYEIAATVGMNTADFGPFTMALPGVLNVVVPVSGPATTWSGTTTRRYDAGGGFAPCQVRNYAGTDATIDSFTIYCRALIVEG